jgi:hypothetical protein
LFIEESLLFLMENENKKNEQQNKKKTLETIENILNKTENVNSLLHTFHCTLRGTRGRGRIGRNCFITHP